MSPAEPPSTDQVCALCGKSSPLIATYLGLCATCLRDRPKQARHIVDQVHARARSLFGLPARPPHSDGGVRCGLCAQDCVIGESERGYCGLRETQAGRLRHLAGTPSRGLLHWYRDPLPTNCVADPFCAGHAHPGKHNLAVFYSSCTLDCLFCQNWHYREIDPARSDTLDAADLSSSADTDTYCVCYFGGDPASQMTHALAAGSRLAEQGVVVCWETNGTAHPKLMDRAVDLSLATGGCVKFDLKAYDDGLHYALTGASNNRTLENFARAAGRCAERGEPPLVVASTLLVPGYVDPQEVKRIAGFIAGIDAAIPLVLLGFAPSFVFPDLPCTSVRHAEEAEAAAREAGLRTVRIGNRHLLLRDY